MPKSIIYKRTVEWFDQQGWTSFPFQQDTWQAMVDGKSGIVNAPTGSGKTYALLLGAIFKILGDKEPKSINGLKIIWVSPIRALTKEIQLSAERALRGIGLDWRVAIRSGDTSTSDRRKQIDSPPQILITTPESHHVILSSKSYGRFLSKIDTMIFDEWHELMGSKRGVQCELLISRLSGINPSLLVWGISATIANLNQAMQVLLGAKVTDGILIQSQIEKKIHLETIFPDDVEAYSWSGHLGIKLIDKIIPIILNSQSTIIFTNTRAQSEIWYQRLLFLMPELAGQMAMHHGSISRELRDWVEQELYVGKLKLVVATSSLDLGVDFRPVETIIQIGSPKSVARFVQRAGRSGHLPGAESVIYFLPTHALELMESSTLRKAIKENKIEKRIPYIRCWDVLSQYLMTLACSGGFDSKKIFEEVKSTHCFESVEEEEWSKILDFLVYGSQSLQAYDEYRKVVREDGIYKAVDRRIIQRHRMSIGTITSEAMLNVKFLKGGRIGSVEEWFVCHLKPGDNFWFAGRALELVTIKDMNVLVRKSNAKTQRIPSYLGGRLPLSSEMSEVLRTRLYDYHEGIINDVEMDKLSPLLERQRKSSIIPSANDFLIEYFKTDEGYHLLMFPFEGRYVHEGMGALIAQRLSKIIPISFSIAMNDYGFELLSDQEIDIESMITKELFATQSLSSDIISSINATELAKRRFRDICRISGLIFQGYPGKVKKERHLQASSSLLFEVFKDYEPDNLLYLQTYEEVMTFQLEEARIREALLRIQSQKLIFKYLKNPSPFSFPIIVDRLREKMSSEKLEDRIRKMTISYSK